MGLGQNLTALDHPHQQLGSGRHICIFEFHRLQILVDNGVKRPRQCVDGALYPLAHDRIGCGHLENDVADEAARGHPIHLLPSHVARLRHAENLAQLGEGGASLAAILANCLSTSRA